MRELSRLTVFITATTVLMPISAFAQQDVEANTTQSVDIGSGDVLLTDAELQTLVAPVALYPDTLLIQILVGATVPFDVMKADRLLLENAGESPEDLKPVILAQNYDPSVEVLAVAFPEVVHDMAEHIDWTETIGDTMLAQSDDVMNAVQVMRDQAINTGALITNDQQTVTEDPETESIVIQPADPEVVYVPQYDSQAVYDTGFGAGDAVTAGLITWGTFTVLDAIFDDDDDWDDYWGCRNCAGWGGGPIVRDPDVDIDIDGNVSVGNEIDIDRDQIRERVETGDIKIDNDELRSRIENGDVDRDELRDRLNSGEIQVEDNDLRSRLENGEGAWVPNEVRREGAREKLENARGEGGATTLPIDRPPEGSTDALRSKLSDRTGAADIARPGDGRTLGVNAGAAAAGGAAGAIAGAAANRSQGGALQGTLPLREGGNRGGETDLEMIKSNAQSTKPVAKPASKKKPAAKPKTVSTAPKTQHSTANVKRPSPKAKKQAPKISKKSSGQRAKAAASRGKKGGGGKRRR